MNKLTKDTNRDSDGYCYNQALEVFGDVEFVPKKEVEGLFGGKLISVLMADDVTEEHPAYISYFDNNLHDINGWNPSKPCGICFLLSIVDSEDGPIANFIKYD